MSFILETIITRMPSENSELVFDTFVRWVRFGGLFHYDCIETSAAHIGVGIWRS